MVDSWFAQVGQEVAGEYSWSRNAEGNWWELKAWNSFVQSVRIYVCYFTLNTKICIVLHIYWILQRVTSCETYFNIIITFVHSFINKFEKTWITKWINIKYIAKR